MTARRHRRAIVAAIAHLRAGDVGRALPRGRGTTRGGRRPCPRRGSRPLECGRSRGRKGRPCGGPAPRGALLRGRRPPPWGPPSTMACGVVEGERAKERHARAAVELAEQLDDDFLRAGALAVLARLRSHAASPTPSRLPSRHMKLASRASRSAEVTLALAWSRDRNLVASFILAPMLILIGRFETARALLDQLERELTQLDEQTLAPVLGLHSMLELRVGRWLLADEFGRRQREIATGTVAGWAGPYVVLAEVALHPRRARRGPTARGARPRASRRRSGLAPARSRGTVRPCRPCGWCSRRSDRSLRCRRSRRRGARSA